MYWTFLQFSPEVLSNERVWFTGACIRSTIVTKLSGHMTQVLNTCLKLFFGGPGKIDFRKGITLNVKPDCHQLVFARFGMLMQDADAHARSCGWRGGERGNNDPTQRLLGKIVRTVYFRNFPPKLREKRTGAHKNHRSAKYSEFG